LQELRVPPPVSTTPLASDFPLVGHDVDPIRVNNHPTRMSSPKPPNLPRLTDQPILISASRPAFPIVILLVLVLSPPQRTVLVLVLVLEGI
jgi:hypothetical protein